MGDQSNPAKILERQEWALANHPSFSSSLILLPSPSCPQLWMCVPYELRNRLYALMSRI